MKVLMLLARSTGGIGTHVDALTRELRALGHDVVIATDPLTADTFGWDAERVWPDSVGGMRRATGRLRHLARGADVVHAHGHQAGALAALVLRTIRHRDRPALVVSLHNAVLGGRGRQVAGTVSAQPFARTAQLVTGASSDLVDQARVWGARWAELAEVPSPRVPGLLAQPAPGRQERRRLAAELLRREGIAAPEGADLVLTIARIAPQKDLDTLVAAAAATRPAPPGNVLYGDMRRNPHKPPHVAIQQTEARSDRGPVWVVVGGGDAALLDRLRRQAETDRAPVHFVGAQTDPNEWLRAAAVFVLTSHWEARALVVQEALAAGTPVIARDAGGLPDLVEGVGTLVPGSDPTDWADAVGAVLDDGERWHTHSAAGRERAATWDDDRETATRWVSRYARARAMT